VETNKPDFAPLDVDAQPHLYSSAFRETYKLTLGAEVSDEFYAKELDARRRQFAGAPDSIVAATLGGVSVGLIVLEKRELYGDLDTGCVETVYILPEHRGKGFGRRLMEYAAEYFKTLGIGEIFLRAGETDAPAIAFFERCGFTRDPFGDKERFGAKLLMFKKCMLADGFDTAALAALFSAEPSVSIAFHDGSQRKNDLRLTFFAEFHGRGKCVIKAAKSGFSTRERVNGWADLTERYNALGIYAPRYLRTAAGDYTAELNGYVVWAEEFSKFAQDKNCKRENFAEELFRGLGLVAASSAPLVPWVSAYDIYDRFSPDDEDVEILANAAGLERRISADYPQYAERIAALVREFRRRYAAFEPTYRALPKAVFQADLNNSNLLFDGGKLAGLMDFNISGTDCVLNYAFCECYYYLEDDDFAKSALLGFDGFKAAHALVEQRLRRNLGCVGEVYKWTDAERAAFGDYYNVSAPFRPTNSGEYHELMDEHGEKYVPFVLDVIEYHLTRADVGGEWLP
jgi:GNAT superfamily N-acetyltransferase